MKNVIKNVIPVKNGTGHRSVKEFQRVTRDNRWLSVFFSQANKNVSLLEFITFL